MKVQRVLKKHNLAMRGTTGKLIEELESILEELRKRNMNKLHKLQPTITISGDAKFQKS